MSRDWSRLRLTISNSFVDWVSAEVVDWGSSGIEIHEPGETGSEEGRGRITLDIFFHSEDVAEAYIKLKNFLAELGQQALPFHLESPEPVPRVDWAENWRYHFPPIPLGENLLIMPPWQQIEPGERRKVIYLQPGMAFGTGHHPTTSMILEGLDKMGDLEGIGCVLDVGCGSAILAIGAARLGAGRILAFDHDPEAVKAARSNVRRNSLEDSIVVVRAQFPGIPAGKPFDLILANLYFTFFEKYIEELGSVAAPGGRAFISGFREEELKAAHMMIERAGMELNSTTDQGGWIMMEAIRP